MECERQEISLDSKEILTTRIKKIALSTKNKPKLEFVPAWDLKILVISKPFDEECNENFIKLLKLFKNGYEIYTNKFSLDAIKNDKRVTKSIKPKLYTDDIHINRIITLGGDGTILFAIKMFYNKCMPPIIGFSMGSVGYLCQFDSENILEVLEEILIKNKKIPKVALNEKIADKLFEDTWVDPYIDYKDRIKVTLNSDSKRETFNIDSNVFERGNKNFKWGSSFNALNELTLEGESFWAQFTVEIYVKGYFLTEVTSWGLIISTPTGSTAYNMSAGGSILQTGVKAISISAINPSTLSFRPLVLPLNTPITIKVPKNVNDTSFKGVIDGDFKFKLFDGDEIWIEGSSDPVPFVSTNKDDPITSWIKKLSSTVLSY